MQDSVWGSKLKTAVSPPRLDASAEMMYFLPMSRYNVELTGEADAALNRLAGNGHTKAEVIRRALSVAAWVEDTQRAGKKILVQDERGEVREIHWR